MTILLYLYTFIGIFILSLSWRAAQNNISEKTLVTLLAIIWPIYPLIALIIEIRKLWN